MTNLTPTGFLGIGGTSLEYKWLAPQSADAPTIVMLHEGLGSVGLWGDLPEKLREATGAGIFVYSRAGYGQSSPVALPRPLDYMQREALDVLPKLLDAIGFKRGLLLGHSDGASIATIYAGAHQDHRLNGLVLIAPHFIVEDISVKSIAAIKTAPSRPPISRPSSRAGTGTSTTPSTAGTAPGSIRNSATGTSRNISPISAYRSWSCKVWTTNMARCARSRSRRKSVIVR
ncbi:pimeloyl-ACP methyl ester carboxylesterase [Bradyrhizobium niftali]